MQPDLIATTSVPLPLLQLDHDGCIRGMNLTAQDCLGASMRQLQGKKLSDLFAPESEVLRLLKRVGETRNYVSDHNLVQRETGAPFSLHLGADEEGVNVIAVPEGNRNELELQTKRHEMAEALARIALEMAHEVKNPLAVLRGAAQWLAEQVQGKDVQEATGMILKEVDRIRERIDYFLQIGPRANVQMESLNIHSLLDDVCHPPSGVSLRKVYDPSLPPVMAHPARLRQAVENLWNNALEAGARHIEWQTRISTTSKLPGYQGPVMEVRITNDGETVPESLHARLFEPFVTDKQRGSGLGLAVVQRVMLEHGGRVMLQAESGRTSFVMQLPLKAEEKGE